MQTANEIERVLFSKEVLHKRVSQLGKLLTERYADKNPIVVCILKGSVVFFADLCRCIDCPLEMDFLSVSSYGEKTTSSGQVKLQKDLDCDIADRHVILVEDILDTGVTLQYVKEWLKARNPASLATVCLLDKTACHAPEITCDYVGFSVENAFVVGYGLDYAQKYRNLPYIGILKVGSTAEKEQNIQKKERQDY